VIATDDVPEMLVFWTLVAVMVAVAAVVGAVKSPLELIEPALADHVMAELYAPVPWTVAAHCDVAPATIEA
jgi:hypothetical protein